MSTRRVDGRDRSAAAGEADRHRHFAGNVLQCLRDDYRLRVDEADLALGLYLRRQTRWVTPDEAAYDAYRWWTPTVEPSVVLAREAEQLAHAQLVDSTDLDGTDSEPVRTAATGDVADHRQTDGIEADLAAAESALAMIRDQGQRQGFTADQVELARRLRQVLDESSVWDSIAPTDSIPTDPERVALEPALRPDTVRPRDDYDDDVIVIDALFAGVTVTVMHQPGGLGPMNSVFFCQGAGGRGTLEVADVTKIGMIAAGDHTPDPVRASEYENLGKQVQNHLMGLAEAVDDSRETLRNQQARRLHAATTVPHAEIGAGRRETALTLGSGT